MHELGLRNDQKLARYVIEGRSTGKQLGTGSYGSVQEVFYNKFMHLGNFSTLSILCWGVAGSVVVL